MANSAASKHFSVRPFQRGDGPKARRLIEYVWREHFGLHPDPFVRDFIYSRLSDIDNAESVYSDRAILLCAVAEMEIIGTGAIKRIDGRECEMTRMFVAPAHRGCGVGRTIADELLKFAVKAGYSQMRLSSNKVLTASHRLYERVGFSATSPWEPGGEEHSRYFVLRLHGPEGP